MAQYLKENIAGVSPVFMKVKTAFVALAKGRAEPLFWDTLYPQSGRLARLAHGPSHWVELVALCHDSDGPHKPTSYESATMCIWVHPKPYFSWTPQRQSH
jgi:hypothetical protein